MSSLICAPQDSESNLMQVNTESSGVSFLRRWKSFIGKNCRIAARIYFNQPLTAPGTCLTEIANKPARLRKASEREPPRFAECESIG